MNELERRWRNPDRKGSRTGLSSKIEVVPFVPQDSGNAVERLFDLTGDKDLRNRLTVVEDQLAAMGDEPITYKQLPKLLGFEGRNVAVCYFKNNLNFSLRNFLDNVRKYRIVDSDVVKVKGPRSVAMNKDQLRAFTIFFHEFEKRITSKYAVNKNVSYAEVASSVKEMLGSDPLASCIHEIEENKQ